MSDDVHLSEGKCKAMQLFVPLLVFFLFSSLLSGQNQT